MQVLHVQLHYTVKPNPSVPFISTDGPETVLLTFIDRKIFGNMLTQRSFYA